MCGECGRSFPTLTPHHFSFNSSLGWCPQCEGLGKQTGTNPAALIDSPRKTLADGAALLWPSVEHEVSMWMLRALSRQTGIPIDASFETLTATHRRILFHGLGERWIEVRASDAKPKSKSTSRLFRFQFKGFYPALEEASRLTPGLRGKLEQFVDEIQLQCVRRIAIAGRVSRVQVPWSDDRRFDPHATGSSERRRRGLETRSS